MEKVLDVENVSISFIQYTKGLNQRDLKVISDLTLDISEGDIGSIGFKRFWKKPACTCNIWNPA